MNPFNRHFTLLVAVTFLLCARHVVFAAPAKSPDDVFKERGLTRVGSFRVVAEETDVLTGTTSLRALRSAQSANERTRRQLGLPLKAARSAFDECAQKWRQAKSELDAQPRGPGRDSYITAYNTALGNWREAEKKLQALQNRQKVLDDSRSAFIGLTVEMMDKASIAAAHYRALAADPILQEALAAANREAQLPIKLGPSAAFTQAVDVALGCRNEMVWDTIEFERHGGTPHVMVVLNRNVKRLMTWDSGASYLCINAETAEAMGLHPTDQDRSIGMTSADGKTTVCKVMTIPSVSVGGITLDNVQCVVSPPGTHSPNLLGQTFQSRCVAKLDVERSRIVLTRLEPPEPGYQPPIPAALDLILWHGSAVPASASIAGAPATRPAIVANRPPEAVLADKGLVKQGFLLVTAEEAPLHADVAAMKLAKGKVDQAKQVRRELGRSLAQANAKLETLLNRSRQLNTAYANASPQEKGRYIDPINSTIKEGRAADARRKQLLTQLENLPDTESSYDGLAVDAADRVQKNAARYAALSNDDELKAALEKLNVTAVPKYQLGPSGGFQEDLSFIAKCKIDANAGDIPIVVDGGNAYVSVTVNESLTIPMVWDSGAGSMLISTDMADTLKIFPTDDDPTINGALADGRVVPMKVVKLKSVRVGGITAYNVECMIQPRGVKVDVGLIGISFQKYFNCRLDLQASTLHLARLAPVERPADAPRPAGLASPAAAVKRSPP